MVASFGTFGRIWSATARHWVLAASAVSWAKAVAMKAETTLRPLFPAWARAFALKVHAAPLPSCAENLRDGGLDALVRVGDDQLDPAQSAAGQLAQELRPDRFGLGCADLQAQNLAPPVGVDPDGDDDGDRHDPPAAPDLEVGGVDPEVGPVAFERAVEEGLHLAVDLLAEPRHLALQMPDMPMALTRSSTERVDMP